MIRRILLSGIFVAFLLSIAYAQDDPLYTFYNGLSDIIESNMNSPDACVKEAEDFISQNIAPLIKISEEGKRRAAGQSTSVDSMSDEQKREMMEKAGEALSNSQGVEALNRFTQLLQDFSASYPDHADKIASIIAGYSK